MSANPNSVNLREGHGDLEIMSICMKNISSGLYNCMSCAKCGRIPNPYERYLCPSGHLLCKICGDQRFTDGGFCGVVSQTETSLPRETTEENHVGQNCLQPLRKIQGDPVFCAFYMHTKWTCPHHLDKKTPCLKRFFGRDMFQHLDEVHNGKYHPEENEAAGAAAVPLNPIEE